MEFKKGDKVLIEGEVVNIHDNEIIIETRESRICYWLTGGDLKKPSSVIFDPTSPEAQALIGKEVEFTDYHDFHVYKKGILSYANYGSESPFIRRDDERGYHFIRPVKIPEISVAEAQALLDKLRQNVKIGEAPDEQSK